MHQRREVREYGRVRKDSGQQRRIRWVALALGVLAFIPIIVQLTTLMVRDHAYYTRLALRNQTRTTLVTGERGIIYDRNMNILACSQSVENVYLDPHELKQSKANLEEIAQVLGAILEQDSQWILEQAQDTRMRYKQIGSRVEEAVAAQVRQYINENAISGIHLEPTSQRYYPYGALASQVIGFTNASNTGSEGIEAAYNRYLEGSVGSVITTKGNNEMDMPFSYENYISSRQGDSVVLTLDATVQTCLEKQMELAVERYDVKNGAFGLVMNVNTGQILAMATLGGYDPNAYMEIYDPEEAAAVEELKNTYLSQPEGSDAYEAGENTYKQAYQTALLKQWRNRCISDGYEPGSTFKVLTMAAALDCGAITLETDFYCKGSEQIPGRAQLLHCWRSTGHGAQKTPQALQNSCNLAFAHIALKLGGERFYEYVEKFGVLEKTGIDLSGESKGVFFSKELVTDTDKWGTASLTSGSFGQTFKLTPLQLVRAIAAVVNGGNLMEPYIVQQVVDADGNVVLQQEPTLVRQVISQETSETMCTLLQSVVEEGTAKNAQVAGFAIGGKTGTSEKIDVFDADGHRVEDKIVSFVGVAPMDNPEYIVLVALDTPSRDTGIYISGGVMAAPTVGAVMADILPYLQVSRSYAPEDAAAMEITVPDLHGVEVAEAQKLLKQFGLQGHTVGEGTCVTGQIPEAGSVVPGNCEILLYLENQPEIRQVTVPDFTGMTRQQANDAAGELGLYILAGGNSDVNALVTKQSESAGNVVPLGTTIRLEFTDGNAAD